MSRFSISELGMGVKALRRLPLADHRGSLTRLFDAKELAAVGWHRPIAQANWVENLAAGTTRGLHYQAASFGETKILWCMAGRICDVCVDIRRGSASFLKHVKVVVSAEDGGGLLIPAGFAHGYQCLTDGVRLLYLHDAAHAPEAERGLNVLDPMLNISWPLPVTGLSARDADHARLSGAFTGEPA